MSTQTTDLLETTMNNFFDVVMKEEKSRAEHLLSEISQSPEMSIKTNINYRRPEDGMTALHFAAMADAEGDNLVGLLMTHGADPKITSDDGKTPAHEAAQEGKLQNLQTILEKNKDLIYASDRKDNTPLHLASFHGRKEVVAYLVTIMTDVNQKDNRGCTALYDAALNAEPECLELLIPQSNIFIRNNNGSTILHAASFEKDDHRKLRKKCIEKLLDNYAGIYGEIECLGIENVDFTNKILIGLKISGTPIENCIDFYIKNYFKNTTLAHAIYTKDQLAKAVKTGTIDKVHLPKMLQACEQNINSMKTIKDYQENPEYIDTLKQLEELSSFLEQLISQPANVFERLKHLVWHDKQTLTTDESSASPQEVRTVTSSVKSPPPNKPS